MYFLIFHSAVNGVPGELVEAAIIDGAGSMDIVNKIHIPNIRSYINVVLTLSLISTLGNFGLVAAATGGGPGYATMTPALYMYKVAFGDGNYGYSSAMGVIIFIILIVITLISNHISGGDRNE
jgi:ABC-type sugar transport system permease subunit